MNLQHVSLLLSYLVCPEPVGTMLSGNPVSSERLEYAEGIAYRMMTSLATWISSLALRQCPASKLLLPECPDCRSHVPDRGLMEEAIALNAEIQAAPFSRGDTTIRPPHVHEFGAALLGCVSSSHRVLSTYRT